jgi:hypothetical protein
MTEIHELVCDNCGTHAEWTGYHLPKGWYVLAYHCEDYLAYDDWRPVMHFCSWGCMANKVKALGFELPEYEKKEKT